MKKELNQTIKYPHKALEKIETTRAEFLENYKRHDFFKKLVFLICFIALIAGLIVGTKLQGGLQPTIQFGVPIVCLAVMFVYGFIVKKRMDLKLRKYFVLYYRAMNEYTLENKNIKKVLLAEPNKITKEEFSENLAFKDIYDVGSRGLTTFTYKKIEASVVDCAAQIKGSKRVQPVFVGKYLRAKSSYKNKEPIIIYLKGSGIVLPPTNIEDKKVVLDNDKMQIFTNQIKWEKTINKKILTMIKGIKTNKLLVDLTISLHDGKQYICMGYDDPLMVPPLEKTFNSNPIEQYKKELGQVLEVMEALN